MFSALFQVFLTSSFHYLLPIADLMPAVQKATCAFCEKQFYKLTLIKAWHSGRTHKRTLKLLNENQHIQIHGNYAEGKLSAVVASSQSDGNVQHTTLHFCSTTNCLNPNFQINEKSNDSVTLPVALFKIKIVTQRTKIIIKKKTFLTYCLHIYNLWQRIFFPCKVVLVNLPMM